MVEPHRHCREINIMIFFIMASHSCVRWNLIILYIHDSGYSHLDENIFLPPSLFISKISPNWRYAKPKITAICDFLNEIINNDFLIYMFISYLLHSLHSIEMTI